MTGGWPERFGDGEVRWRRKNRGSGSVWRAREREKKWPTLKEEGRGDGERAGEVERGGAGGLSEAGGVVPWVVGLSMPP